MTLAIVRVLATMSLHRVVRAAIAGIALAAFAAVASAAGPQDAPQGLYDALLKAMKGGATLGYAGRKAQLDPAVRAAIDLPLMARLVVGPAWRGFTADQRSEFTKAFSDYSIGVYAARFSSFGGERFEVDPTPTVRPNGDAIVHTRLVVTNGDPVALDYLVRNVEGRWQIIDIFLNGTISQLATQRSEYSATLQNGGAAALIRLVEDKDAALG